MPSRCKASARLGPTPLRNLTGELSWRFTRSPDDARTARNQRVFFFNDTATTEIYTLSLHDALPIFPRRNEYKVQSIGRPYEPSEADDRSASGVPLSRRAQGVSKKISERLNGNEDAYREYGRSEEHTSELQSRLHLVCRLLLEKKKTI